MGPRNRNPADYLYSAARAMGEALDDANRMAMEAADDYTELPRKHPDGPRRLKVDCRVCQGAGAECHACGGRGTEIIEIDPDREIEQ